VVLWWPRAMSRGDDMTAASGLHFTLTLDALPDSELVVVGFEGEEALSEPFQIQLECASTRTDLPLSRLLDSRGELRICVAGHPVRRVDGIVTAATRGESGFRRTRYRLQLSSPLWRLQLRHNCRIFQAQTPQQIIMLLLREHGIPSPSFMLRATHPAREYCVQYRETDLHFLQRLAAEEGIFYYHNMAATPSRLVFADEASTLASGSELLFNPQPNAGNLEWRVHRFESQHQLRPTSVSLQDHSFLQPDYALAHSQCLSSGYVAGLATDPSAGRFHHYDFPGRFKQDASGKAFVRYRLDALRQDAELAMGQSNSPLLQTGQHWRLTQLPELASEWQAIRIHHTGQQPQALEEEGGAGATVYHNQFQAIPASHCWRPVPESKPRVDGPQIARVVGPEGETLYCDEYGRIKLQFPWDRGGQNNEHSSCWVRVSQGWAGGHYGSMALPRVGHEVIVSFLEGDPDQPIVTGRTYHATNVPPYPLPAHKSRTVLRTESYQGDGFNELSFEDQAGQEEIFLHGQKDLLVHVEQDVRWQIQQDEHASIRASRFTRVGKGDHLLVEGEQRLQIDQNYSLQVGQSLCQHIAQSCLIEVGREVHLKAGTQLVLDAGSELTIKAGGSFIKLDAGGITLQGACIRLNSGGEPGMGSDFTRSEPLLPQGVGAPEYIPPPALSPTPSQTAETDEMATFSYRFSE
jgi:type VI secretion system secreted protein VgrG